ncbi:hypothetical protein [Haloechinothrix aidingensis]|uniref:hypothetical protein n=1 Tax=Haloechinothrix aidingensis TaxID=2752311 RepID=UPI001C610EB4|nr:hypothetical protein [Haloechinothrix aidingensis]
MSLRRRLFCGGAAVLVGAAMLTPTTTATADTALPEPVTAGGLPTPQTDGIVFDVEIVGDTVYAGGRFDHARPAGAAPGEHEVPRRNLMAFDLHTGELLDWGPTAFGSEFSSGDPGLSSWCRDTGNDRWICDSVFRIETDPAGEHVYVAGDFDRMDGTWRSRIAAFDAGSGELTSFDPPPTNRRVRALSVGEDAVYFGGGFTSVGGTSRTRLAAVDHEGNLLDWAPAANREVWAVLARPDLDRVLIGGGFDEVNGSTKRSMAAVDATSGDSVAWQAQPPAGTPIVTDIVSDGSDTAWISALDFRHGGGEQRFEGRMSVDISSGTEHWWDGCLGDSMRMAVTDEVLYSVTHAHDCWAVEAIPERGADFRHFRMLAQTKDAVRTAPRDHTLVSAGDPIPEILPWFPNTNAGKSDTLINNGTWAIDATEDYVVVGGDFTAVNTHSRDSHRQQSLTRFAARGVDGARNNGPQWPFRAPELDSVDGGVKLTWPAIWNAQNGEMHYEVMRAGTPEPIHVTDPVPSRPWYGPEPWEREVMSYVDTGASSGTYWIRAIDADGERVGSSSATIG